jgi:hypothetical protein
MAPTSREAYLAWKQNIAFDTAYPRFNPFIYSLENDLPLVKLAQDDKWAPDPSHKSTVWTKSNIPFRLPSSHPSSQAGSRLEISALLDFGRVTSNLEVIRI